MTKRIDERAALLSTRRQILMAGAAAGAAMLLPRVAGAASVPYEFECDRNAGFLPDPNEHKRVGYITDLSGFGMTGGLVGDLTVFTPWAGSAAPAYPGVSFGTSGPNKTAKVVGVIEKFSWNGGVGDAIKVDIWMSQENAIKIKSAQQSTLASSSKVNSLGWWIINYDQETKVWYEQSFPLNPAKITGQLKAGAVNVDLAGAPVKNGLGVLVYKVSLQVSPGANQQYALRFANAPAKPVVKNWGLVVGTLANQALAPQ
jgi:hypothetical protein